MNECPFCGLDPYTYVDVGFGKPGIPVGVDCCKYGYLLFDGGKEYNHRGMPLDEVMNLYKQEKRK